VITEKSIQKLLDFMTAISSNTSSENGKRYGFFLVKLSHRKSMQISNLLFYFFNTTTIGDSQLLPPLEQ
jgi:hypothetical protein